MSKNHCVRHVLVGRAVPLERSGRLSGIHKTPVAGPVAITATGLSGDEQGDRRHHGGPEKAVHHYPFQHYAAWQVEHPPLAPYLASPGAFGENLSTLGFSEADVRVGDVYRIGTALLQVSQARQPCWKLNVRFALPEMARRVQTSGRTGWYYRVLEPGTIRAGDELVLVESPNPDWTLDRVLHYLNVDTLNPPALRALASLPFLAESWRSIALRRLVRCAVEDWEPRLSDIRPPTPKITR
jgi:MOSC domain-containing protein YiiM